MLAASVCFGLRSLVLKYVTAGGMQIDAMSVTIVYLLADGVIGIVWIIVVAVSSTELNEFTGHTYALGLVAGLITAAGIFSLNLAITVGATGPAFALAYTFPVLQAILTLGLLAQVPGGLEWAGLFLAVIGAITLSIGDEYVVKPIRKAMNERKYRKEMEQNLYMILEEDEAREQERARAQESGGSAEDDMRQNI